MKEHQYESVQDDCIYNIKVGENAQENWDLISASEQNDIWFHVENNPSCHVVLSVGSKKPHKSVINYCASLCKEGSKRKNSRTVNVIYTEIRNVRKADKPGSVTTRNTKTTKA